MLKKIVYIFSDFFEKIFDKNKYRGLLWTLIQRTYKNSTNCSDNGEIFFVNKILSFIKPYKPIVIDVGANIGIWSQSLLKLNPSVNILAVEAVPEFFNECCHNIGDRVKVINIALMDRPQIVTLHQYGGGVRQGKNQCLCLERSM
jgi:hypothetical protein